MTTEETTQQTTEPGVDESPEVNTATVEGVDGVDAAPEEINQEAVNKRIAEKHRGMKDAERAQVAAEKQRDDLQRQLDEANKKPAPVIPDAPDQFDDNFATLQANRELAIQQKAQFDHEQQLLTDSANRAAQAAVDKKNQEAETTRLGFVDRTKELGIDINTIDVAGKTLTSFGIGDELGSYLMKDADGPLIVNYLANNLQHLESVAGMSPMDAAVFIQTTVRPEAQKLKPKQTEAPDPAVILTGNGQPAKDLGPSGATYE